MFQFERDVDKHAFDASSKVHSDNKVIGNTGEDKHEEIFFNKRGKLFYFYSGQWKEKGVGYIQIIFYRGLKAAFLKITKQNCTKLMVPTYYVYQHISSCMKIHPFQKSDKAFSWFAENKLRYEHLCICFKTADIAAAFKAAFEKVLNILKENKIGNITNLVIKSTTDTYPVTQQPYGTRSLPKADSWTCPVCYTNNAADKLVCVACQAKKPGSQATSASNSITTITSSTKSNANLFTFNVNDACSVSSPKSTFSGFTFWPSPVLKEVKPASTSIPIASSSGNSTANQFTLGENSAVFASVINQNNMFDGLTFSTVPMIKDKKTVSPSISVATSTSNSTANLFSFNQNSAVISSVSEQRNISQGLTFFTGRRIKKTKTDTKARGTLVASTKSEKCQASSYFGFSCVSSHSTAVTSSFAGLKPVCHYDRNQSVIITGRSAASTENNISKMNSVLPNINFVNTLYSRSSESFATFSNYNVCASNCASSSNVSAYSLPSHNNVSTEDQKMSTNIINDFAYKFATAAEVKPVVSLPALVEVKSSEDEKELFGEQAKLLRFDFDEKEWKKYCTGELKILYLKARKMGRISMRTGKLCTNQYIFPHMQLTPLANNNEAWIWYAEDVSDGELKKEMFAAKFKSTEIAQEFFKTFHACQSKLDEITEEKKLHLDDKFQPGAYMGNKKIFDEQPSTCTEKASPGLLGTIKHSSVGFPSEIKPLTWSTALPFFGLSSVAEASATAGFKSVFPANNAARGGLTQKSEILEIKSVPIPLATDSFESSASLSKFNVDLSASSKKSDASLFGSVERPKGCEFNFKGSLYGNAKTLMASIPTLSCIDDEDEEDSFDKCLPPDVPLPPEADDNFLNEIEEVTFYGPGILFSFSDGDWKKQGIGNIKICVYRLTKKAPRLLMQEEGVSNLCADHYFTSNMELHGLKNSERVFFWLAVVHTVEGMRLQHLCVCFRTINIAAAFKTAFEEALKIAKENEATTNTSPVTQKPFGVTFLPKDSSWTCQTCYVSNAADKLLCVACETKKRGCQVTAGSNSISVSTSITNSTANQFTFSINSFSQRFKVTSVSSSKNTLGVSTFSASPVMPEKKSVIKSRAMLLALRKKYKKTRRVTEVTAPKPCPFSGFSFKSPPTAVVSSSSTVQFVESTESAKARVKNNISKIHSMLQTITPDDMFGSKSAESVATFPNFSISVSKSSAELTVPTSSAPLFVNVSAEGRRVSIDAAYGAPEEFVRTAEFKPIVPLPALVDVKTVGEREEKLFGERAELFRFDREGKEWGIGELKILFLPDSKKYKILMQREQVLKIGANHYILPDMKLGPVRSNDKAWAWFAEDFSDGDLKEELFAAKFKTKEIAQEFFEIFQKCQSDLKEIADKNEKPQIAKSQSDTCTGNKTAFDELFKPVASLWECSKCQKSNMNESSCVYCSTPKSGTSVVTGKSSLVSEQKPLSELFKPDKNSWECQACYDRNKSCDVKCVSCESSQQSSSDTFNKNAISNNQNMEPISYVKNGKSEPLTNLFKPPVGSWQCQSCLIQYNSDVDKCAACETKKPGSSFASSAFPSSSDFGKFQCGSSVQSTSSTEKTSPFSFGSNKPSSGDFLFEMKPITQSTTFSFGLSSVIGKGSETVGFKPTLPTSNTPAVFGGTTQKSDLLEKKSITIPQTTSAPTDAFGNTSSTSIFSFDSPAGKEADSSSVEFRFGSPQKYEFNFSGVRPRSPTKTPVCPKSSSIPSDVVQPAIPLPPKVETGEENEEVMFCKRARLFRFSAGEWKERGIGNMKVLFGRNSKKARLLMRRDQVLKVCLNHLLNKEIVLEWRGNKSLTWTAIDFSENETSPELFAIRFRTNELAQQFKDAIDDALKLNALAGESEVSSEQACTTTKVVTNFSFKSDSSVKTEPPFNAGSLSACFGTTLQGKSLFGNSANVLGTTETKPSSSVSPFFQTDKLGTSSVFGQNVNFSTNSSKSIFGGHGLKFGLAPTEQKSEDKDLTKIKVSDSTMQKRENSVISQKTSSPLEAENNHVVLEFETNEHNSNEESEEGDFIFEKRVPFEAFDESSDQFKTGKPEKESEEVIFCGPAALFCYTSREGNVRGVGDIKVLFNGVSKKAHLVMRKEHVLKVCLNRYIVKEMSFEWWDEKSMKWAAIDFFNNKPSCEIFAVQFETSALAYKFKEAIEYAMKLIKEAEISGDQTPRTTEDLVNLPIRSNFSIKTNSPFTESVSTCLGETWQDKPFFGNSRSANFSEDTTSVFSPGLELSLKNKFTAFPAFTQHSNFSANNSKPVFQSFGFKFETDDFADEGKHSILTEESIVLDDSADEEKHSLSTEKSTYYSADEGKLSLSTEENIDESPDDGKHSLPKFSEINECSLHSENSKDTCMTFVKSAVFSDLSTHSTFEDISKPSSAKNISSSDENLFVSSADASTVTSEDGSADDGKHSLPKFSEANVGSLCSENSKDTCTTFVKNAVFSDLATHSTSEDISKPSSMKGVSSSDENLLVSSSDTSATSEAS